MCFEHGPFCIPANQWYYQVKNPEYTKLDLPFNIERPEGNEGIHCEYCIHYIDSFDRIIYIAIVIGLISIFKGVQVTPPVSAIPFIILGMIIISLGTVIIYLNKKDRFFKMQKSRPPLPVFGRFPSVNIHESVKSAIVIDRNGIHADGEINTNGVIQFNLQLSEAEQERLKKYRQKYLLPAQCNIAFHSGFIILREAQRLQPISWREENVNPISLIGYTDTHPFFSNVVISGSRQWSSCYKYTFGLDIQSISRLPVQIIPSLLSEGDEWALEFFIQMNSHINVSSLTTPRIEDFRIQAPNILGDVENHSPPALVKKENNINITWQNINFVKESNRPYSTVIYIRFANNKNISEGIGINGRLRLHFEGAISKLGKILWFSPLGDRRDNKDITVIKDSSITLDFHFQLAHLHVRKLYSVKDSIEQLTTIPGNEMITRLVNAMNNNHMYVQRVIENPPSMNRANAQIMNRLWVIAGRRYEEAIPIDFRVVAIGQEQYEDSDKPYAGNTKFEIAAQGTITHENMKCVIERLKNDLIKIIQHIPILEMESWENPLYKNEWGEFIGTIINKGNGIARDVTISAIGIRVGEKVKIQTLEPGDSRSFTLSVYPNEKGQVPITITAVCKDEFGEMPPAKRQIQVMVEERSSQSSITTNFFQPVAGNIHTGSGNIDLKKQD